MNLFKRTSVIFIILLTLLSFETREDKTQNSINVMAYYMTPRENYQPQDLPLEKLTHIIFSFTVVIDNEMKFENPEQGEKLSQLVDQKKNHPHLKVMIACGGWGGSEGFSDMAATTENRKKFVDSAVRFLLDYKLDGLDIDWEYPGMYAAGNPYRPEDKENFTSLMRELRKAMDKTGQKLTLTFASAGWENYYRYIELEACRWCCSGPGSVSTACPRYCS